MAPILSPGMRQSTTKLFYYRMLTQKAYEKTFSLLFFMGIVIGALAQKNEHSYFEKKRIAIDQTGMTILGSWAITNMGVSAFT
jgi:hypothetical protein